MSKSWLFACGRSKNRRQTESYSQESIAVTAQQLEMPQEQILRSICCQSKWYRDKQTDHLPLCDRCARSQCHNSHLNAQLYMWHHHLRLSLPIHSCVYCHICFVHISHLYSTQFAYNNASQFSGFPIYFHVFHLIIPKLDYFTMLTGSMAVNNIMQKPQSKELLSN